MSGCLYCGAVGKLEAEHMVPRSRGGTNIPENLFSACRRCNVSKRNSLPSEWRDDLPAVVYELEKTAVKLHEASLRPKRLRVAPKKNAVVAIRCTRQQRDAIETAAAREGLAVSSWLLRIGLVTAQQRTEK